MPSPTSRKQLEERPCKHFAIVIMRRPRRAAVGVLSPRRALKLGKIRQRACLRLIPFPSTGDVLLAPTMISHPLAYVAPNPRQSVSHGHDGRSHANIGRKIPAHPYLACQMSDFGFRQTLEVQTLGCARRFNPLPSRTSPNRWDLNY